VATAFVTSAEGQTPSRVVSINLCTDQLAMLIAAPGQLLSVSYLARDLRLSTMTAEAAAYPVNHGRAEEVVLHAPDLVLADVWSSPTTLSMLERLGLRVERFEPGATIGDVAANIRRMGALLGRKEVAEALARDVEARLAALPPAGEEGPLAALYGPNSYLAGVNSLSGQIVATAGYRNVAAGFGIEGGGTLPLEALVMAGPDVLITGAGEPGRSRAEEVLSHPALALMPASEVLADADWTCATPAAVAAVERLVAARAGLEAGP
jgi:iron complex transport system substrate-binding protein